MVYQQDAFRASQFAVLVSLPQEERNDGSAYDQQEYSHGNPRCPYEGADDKKGNEGPKPKLLVPLPLFRCHLPSPHRWQWSVKPFLDGPFESWVVEFHRQRCSFPEM